MSNMQDLFRGVKRCEVLTAKDVTFNEYVCSQIRRVCDDKGISTSELTEIFNCNSFQLESHLSGTVSISLASAVMLCERLDLSIEYLYVGWLKQGEYVDDPRV